MENGWRPPTATSTSNKAGLHHHSHPCLVVVGSVRHGQVRWCGTGGTVPGSGSSFPSLVSVSSPFACLEHSSSSEPGSSSTSLPLPPRFACGVVRRSRTASMLARYLSCLFSAAPHTLLITRGWYLTGVLFPAALFLPILEFGAIKENVPALIPATHTQTPQVTHSHPSVSPPLIQAKLGLFASAAACLVTGIGAVAYYLCFHTAFLKELMGGSSSSSGGADTGYPKDDGSLLVDGADGGIGANPAVQPAYAAPQYGADSSGYSQPTYFAQPQYGSSSAAAVDPNAALLMKAPEVTTTDGKYTY